MKPLFVLLLALIASSSAWGQVPKCSGLEHELPVSFEMQGQSVQKLPQDLLVAKSAELWIQNIKSGFKLWASHNFKSGLKSFNCATLPDRRNKNFSFFGPVILDRTSEQKEGSTLWQFQFLVQGTQLGIWNQKSNLIQLKQVLKATGPGAWRWVEDKPGSIRLFRLNQASEDQSIFWIDFEKADQ